MAALQHLMKTVTAAGTAERLSSTSIEVLAASIQVESDNTGVIVIGGSTVSVTDYGSYLPVPTAGATPPAFNLARPDKGNIDLMDVWIDSSVSGDGVSVSYIEAAMQGTGIPKT